MSLRLCSERGSGRGIPAAAFALWALFAGATAEPSPGLEGAGEIPYRTVEGASPQPLPEAGLRTREELESFADGFVGGVLEAYNVAGLTLSVVRDGQLFFAKGYGYAHLLSKLPMQPWHRSRIGSVSNVITAIGLLQLLEAGEGDPGSLAVATNLQAGLTRSLYGHPGPDFDDADWPTVTGPTVLDNPEVYWEAMRTGVQNAYPDTFETEIRRNYPVYVEPPPLDDERPNETSWTYFRKVVPPPQ